MMRTLVLSAILAASALTTSASAAPPSKEECLDAHGRGQDLRESRQLARARGMFLVCATSACPALVQADCARFADELGRLVPSVTFAARDERGADLPQTQVYMDDILVATRLDDGKSYDVDPGRHAIRFVHDGKDFTVRVVVNQGEKARPIQALFGSGQGAEPAAGAASQAGAPSAPPPLPKRPVLPLAAAGAGLVAAAVGTALLVAGASKVPASCSMSSKECAAPPGDKAFEDARSGVSMMNTGIAIGIVGAVALAGGLVWYFVQSPTTPDSAPPAQARSSPFVVRF
jgi:hypothetical protein